MSHLGTIIMRVKRKLEVYDNDPQEASKDPLFRQAVKNLQEYQEAWNDQTQEEVKEADRLYARYIHLCRED